MKGSFASQTYSISTLLGRSSFPSYTPMPLVVPRFQRSYSWGLSQVTTFWNDILSFHEQMGRERAQNTYFLGPIVILPERDRVVLLDGQQRLATVTILLAAIRDIARQSQRDQEGSDFSDLARDIHRDFILVDDESGSYALKLGELDQPYFQTHVQEDPPTETVKARLRSHRLIRQAQSFLRKSLEGLVDRLGPKETVSKLKSLQRTLTAHVKLVAIEVQSEDEAYLIFETLNDRGLRLAVPDLVLNYLMRTAENDRERDEIRQSWNSALETLGQRKVSTFIRHMWVSRYGDVKSQGLFREIRKNLGDRGISSLEFAKLCAKESQHYAVVTGPDREALGTTAYPHVEALVKHLRADQVLPLLLSGVACLEDREFAKLARALVVLVTRYSILAGLNLTTLEERLYSAARALRAEHEDGRSSRTCLKAAKDVLRPINPTAEQVRSAIAQVSLTKKQAQYVVCALAEKVQSRTKAVSLASNSIEHIFPENAQQGDWPGSEEMEGYAWRIGNLTVLEPALNRKAGRSSYEAKRAVYSQSSVKMTQDIAERYELWNRESISERAYDLLPLIEEIWPESI